MTDKKKPGDDRTDPPSAIDQLKEKIMQDYDRLGLDDTFRFACHRGVPCFNKCCADVNIFLTPYDVLRLKNALSMKSDEFLAQYTQIPIEKHQKYPVVMLKMSERPDKKCQLVTEEGCTVYHDRPWPCRMYPLGLASPKDKDARDFYFLMKEDVCEGFTQGQEWTVKGWIQNQAIEKYDAFGKLFKEITLHDYFAQGKVLSPQKMEMFYTACYDLDNFRRFVLESTFLLRFEVDSATVEAMRLDDESLLRFGFRWLKFALFGEPTIKVRPEAMGPVGTPPK